MTHAGVTRYLICDERRRGDRDQRDRDESHKDAISPGPALQGGESLGFPREEQGAVAVPTVEILGEFAGVLVAVGGVGGEAVAEDRLEVGGEVCSARRANHHLAVVKPRREIGRGKLSW